jgi:hypothetical protein
MWPQAFHRLVDTMTCADEETAQKARRLDALRTRFRDNPRGLSCDGRLERCRLAGEARSWKRSEFVDVSAGLTTS